MSADLKHLLHELEHHLEHVLPAQAPIKDFVHHNTLHGFQHLPFRAALAAAEAAIGAHGFLPAVTSRAYFQQGRITREDLDAALDETPELRVNELLTGGLSRRAVLCAGLLHDFSPPAATWAWQVESAGVLRHPAADLSATARAALLRGRAESDVIPALWAACQGLLDTPPVAEAFDADAELAALLRCVGHRLTLRGVLLRLTGRDVLDELRPYLIRHLANFLDQGLAALHAPTPAQGFYAAWLASAQDDPHFALHDMDEWESTRERLPDNPVAAIAQSLQLLGLDEADWPAYLETLAKELPGWSGMVLWRHGHPGYAGLTAPVGLADYLAVRLVLEQVYAQHFAGRHFKTEASLSGLRGYFHRHPSELQVRLALYGTQQGALPESLADQAHRLVREATGRNGEEVDADWRPVARLIEAALAQPATNASWRLFRLAQHLGLDADAVQTLGATGAAALLECLAELTPERQGWVWLQAYERHYREQVFAALAANHGRGAWVERGGTSQTTPQAQLVFCMDDREEGLRRHLEERHPRIETLGAAAHFSVFIRYTGLGEVPTDLCPVVARPAHTIVESAAPETEARAQGYLQAQGLRRRWKTRLLEGSRRTPWGAALASGLGALVTLPGLALKSLAPAAAGQVTAGLRQRLEGTPSTRLTFTALEATPATPDAPRAGFTDMEQADRVFGFLRNIGLTSGFAPLVVIVGHGSNSLNNPHMSAYDCGACSGRHSGANARLFAAMANRPEVRALLRERSLDIPAATWFMGCEHNTCDDRVTWYDTEQLPSTHVQPLRDLQVALVEAGQLHAQERSRRFMSASLDMTPKQAFRHVLGRRHDFSQARPELGHATNASAFIGRRAATRGAFFDRRMFLISYDSAIDPEGTVLEPLLLANGPVGAGISLEYYFSTVNNERYGCGTKVMHNVAGLFGVMDGAASDLRTGLPRQMIEIHEAMRLLVIVEHRLDVLTAIYQRQPPLQELIGNGWIQLAAKDPDSEAIHRFVPGAGWVAWQAPESELPRVRASTDWVRGQREPLPPALIEMEPVA